MKLSEGKARELISQALKARESSYCPYSNFAVGAALLCNDGTVYTGCNVETAAFSGCCAGKEQEPDFFCTPCGVCRQVMREFCKPDFEIIMTDGKDIKVMTLEELLPMAFGPDDLA